MLLSKSSPSKMAVVKDRLNKQLEVSQKSVFMPLCQFSKSVETGDGTMNITLKPEKSSNGGSGWRLVPLETNCVTSVSVYAFIPYLPAL